MAQPILVECREYELYRKVRVDFIDEMNRHVSLDDQWVVGWQISIILNPGLITPPRVKTFTPTTVPSTGAFTRNIRKIIIEPAELVDEGLRFFLSVRQLGADLLLVFLLTMDAP